MTYWVAYEIHLGKAQEELERNVSKRLGRTSAKDRIKTFSPTWERIHHYRQHVYDIIYAIQNRDLNLALTLFDDLNTEEIIDFLPKEIHRFLREVVMSGKVLVTTEWIVTNHKKWKSVSRKITGKKKVETRIGRLDLHIDKKKGSKKTARKR